LFRSIDDDAIARWSDDLLVDPAQVAHTMDDALTTTGQCLADLRQPSRGVAVEITVGGARTGDGDLADLSWLHEQVVRPSRDRVVIDGDNAHLVRRHRATDAGAGAGFRARTRGL